MAHTQLGLIRPIADSELALMLEWRNAPSVRENMYTQHSISLEEHITWWNRTRQNTAHQYFMYEYNGQPSAIASLNGIDRNSQRSDWAFYAAPDAPRGTGSRLEYLMLEHTFGSVGLHKLSCEVLAYNSAVIKMHQKFGFVVEGIFRQHFRQPDGQYVDIHRLGLLADEWQQQRESMLERLLRHQDRG